MKKLIVSIVSALLMVSMAEAQSLVDKVDLFMGQHGNSQCVIGPQVPHGSINPSPDTPDGGHDGYAEDKPIRGFSQLHVSGTGWGRYGQILLSPQIGFNADEEGHDSEKAEEVATPYYYKVRLTKYDILCEVTPSHHSAIYRFTFPDKSDRNILLDITHNLPEHIVPAINGKYISGDISYDFRDRMLVGYGEYRGGFGDGSTPYKVYFALWSDNIDLQKAKVGSIPYDNGVATSKLFAKIPVADGQPSENTLCVAVSMRSIDNAKKFLIDETIGKGFGTLMNNCRTAWEKTLSAIKIGGASNYDERVFYTCLYYANVMPRERTDDNPRWLGVNYDDHYCIWDTWRTKMPLMILTNKDVVNGVIAGFINRFKNDGRCNPTFTSALDWTERQGGDDCENVIADAMVKGLTGFDRRSAYEYVKWNATHRRSPDYQRLGWQPETGGIMSCSTALEYAYNDYCAYEIAKKMGDRKFAKQMKKRSRSWRKLFNPAQKDEGSDFTGFIVPKKENGEFINIPVRYNYGSWVEYFYEGNSWTNSLFAPHDFKKLIRMNGGKKKMTQKLDYGFANDLITLWNEPGFLSPFLFHHCGRPELTAKYVSRLRKSNYSLEGGFIDNEDSGAMGAWYVFTAMGLFPNAGQDFYYLLPPAYPSITVALSNGNSLVIEREGSGEKIKNAYLNGKKLRGNTIKHSKLMQGGTLRFVMTDK